MITSGAIHTEKIDVSGWDGDISTLQENLGNDMLITAGSMYAKRIIQKAYDEHISVRNNQDKTR